MLNQQLWAEAQSYVFSLAFQGIRGTFKFEKHWASSIRAFKVDCFFCFCL